MPKAVTREQGLALLERYQTLNMMEPEPLPDPLRVSELLAAPGVLFAIDAEFVSLGEEEAEFTSEGVKRITRPVQLAVGRVSVVRGEGPGEGTVCLDDYVEPRDPVADYLTAFSGIERSDLQREVSSRRLVSLKTVYRKLRYMVDAGCVFVGHSLDQDFRTLNLMVPPSQVVDTVHLYHIPSAQRKLSLKFLAWAGLGVEVQRGQHDSIEDARTALDLYRRYRELQAEGTWTAFLKDVYQIGVRSGFRAPSQTT